MAYNQALTDFAQKVYLTIKNRRYDDIEGEDGQEFISQIIDWGNQAIDEIELATDASGRPVVWNWLRQNNYDLGSATEGESTISLGSTIKSLVRTPHRYVEITVDDKVVSRWSVVNPNQLSSKPEQIRQDMVAKVGRDLIFSRAFTANEDGGSITGDVVIRAPRLSETNQKILTLIEPLQLLTLGVAKNCTLPDIVQGGLSPSFVQKYNDVLQSAILDNAASSQPDYIEREDFSSVGGVW